jgi:hypothetical protein
LRLVAEVIIRIGPDVLNMVEVEHLSAPALSRRDSSPGTAIWPT